MLLNDSLVFVLQYCSAVIFTILTFLPLSEGFEEELATDGFHVGMIPAVIRIMCFPIFAGIAWAVLAYWSFGANNCASNYGGAVSGACFTSPTYAATTAVVYQSLAAFGLPYFDILLSVIMLMMALIIGITMFGVFTTYIRNRRSGGNPPQQLG